MHDSAYLTPNIFLTVKLTKSSSTVRPHRLALMMNWCVTVRMNVRMERMRTTA